MPRTHRVSRGIARAASLHFVGERDEDARARTSDWMPQGDGAAVDVGLGEIELQFALTGEN